MAFDNPTVFISCSSDMHEEAQIVRNSVHEIARTVPSLRNLQCYLWSEADTPWRSDVSWQQSIPRASDDLVVMMVSLIGERIGSRLPPSFEIPADVVIPSWVNTNLGENGVPLTGTVFEFLDFQSANERRSQNKAPHLVYIRGSGSLVCGSAPSDQRSLGHRRLLRRLAASSGEDEMRDYFAQVKAVTAFLDLGVRPRENGCRFIADDDDQDALKAQIRKDIQVSLAGRETGPGQGGRVGLRSFDSSDAAVFFGRSTFVENALEDVRRTEASPSRGTGAVIVGVSGVGKSSALKAGICGQIELRQFDTNAQRFLAVQVTTPSLDGIRPLLNLLNQIGLKVPALRAAIDELVQVDLGMPLGELTSTAALARLQIALGAIRGGPAGRDSRDLRLVIAYDQIDDLLDRFSTSELTPEWKEALTFLLEGARRRLFWFVTTVSDGRLAAWNRIAGSTASHLLLWPLSNPDRDGVVSIITGTLTAADLTLPAEVVSAMLDSAEVVTRSRTAALPLLAASLKRLIDEALTLTKQRRDAELSDADSAVAPPIVRAITFTREETEKLRRCADVAEAIESLAEEAFAEWQTAAGGSPDSLPGLFRKLVAADASSTLERVTLLRAVSSAAVADFAKLIDELSKRRLATIEQHADIVYWSFAHEAVVRHWSRTITWYKGESTLLGFIEAIKPIAKFFDAAAEGDKSRFLLPAGFVPHCLRALRLWHDDPNRIPATFLTASVAASYTKDLDNPDEEGVYPLSAAVAARSIELCKRILAEGADPNRPNAKTGTTSIMVAARFCGVEINQLLIGVGARLDAVNKDGFRLGHYAVSGANVDVLKYLAAAGADFGAPDPQGDIPARWAPNTDVLRCLAECGAPIHQRNNEGFAPIDYVLSAGSVEMAEWIIDRGIYPPEHSYEYARGLAQDMAWKPLALLAKKNLLYKKPQDSLEASNLLRDAIQKAPPESLGPIVSALAQASQSLRQEAFSAFRRKSGRMETFEILLANKYGPTVQELTSEESWHPWAETIREEVDAISPEERTRIAAMGYTDRVLDNLERSISLAETACHQDGIDAIRRYLSAGGDVNATSQRGQSLIQIATAWRSRNVVDALLRAGADPHRTDPAGGDALAAAQLAGLGEIAARFAKHDEHKPETPLKPFWQKEAGASPDHVPWETETAWPSSSDVGKDPAPYSVIVNAKAQLCVLYSEPLSSKPIVFIHSAREHRFGWINDNFDERYLFKPSPTLNAWLQKALGIVMVRVENGKPVEGQYYNLLRDPAPWSAIRHLHERAKEDEAAVGLYFDIYGGRRCITTSEYSEGMRVAWAPDQRMVWIQSAEGKALTRPRELDGHDEHVLRRSSTLLVISDWGRREDRLTVDVYESVPEYNPQTVSESKPIEPQVASPEPELAIALSVKREQPDRKQFSFAGMFRRKT